MSAAHTPVVSGIHHVTAFAGDAARNRSFYCGLLRFELVKRTVNFDAPSMWHLYYGAGGGLPGTLLTHFPEPRAARARHGGSEITRATLACDRADLEALATRLDESGVRAARESLFGRDALVFEDPDGMQIAVEALEAGTARQQPSATLEVARVAVAVPDAEETAAFLVEVLGFERAATADGLIRLAIAGGGCGREIDVAHAPGRAAEPLAAGTIHHVAWRVPDDAAQARASTVLADAGVAVTPVRDRMYFRSIYFRIPGGILFEIATDGPGFAIDEPAHRLGRSLMLPPQYEPQRARIEAQLPPLE